MTTPLYALLWFTVWTIGIATVGIGAWRVGNVLLGKAKPNAFPADTPRRAWARPSVTSPPGGASW